MRGLTAPWDRWSSRIASQLRLNAARAAAPRSQPPPPNHHLTLYEYEASPWCRLVREHLTILDLKVHIRPCPRQTLWLEGAYSSDSRFRSEAMELFEKKAHTSSDHDNVLTFPLLVDRTDSTQDPVVLSESCDILQHLWERYGESVLPTPTESAAADRPDQLLNSPRIPFPLRFLSLAGPSYLRPWPRCGLMRTPSSVWNADDDCDDDDGSSSPSSPSSRLILYQAEGDPESRLVREVLCTLELPYLSISSGLGSDNSTLSVDSSLRPVLLDKNNDDDDDADDISTSSSSYQGAEECIEYLWGRYRQPNAQPPSWFDAAPPNNLGRAGPFSVGAYAAFLRGARALVPSRAME
jgi:hypothetical protein